jgi:DNA uptake protein ComE-like DNA-binding protein
MKTKNLAAHFFRWTTDFLTYNQSEQRGILVLGLILLCLIVANAVIPSGTFSPVPDFTKFSREIRDFEAAWQHAADSDSMARVKRFSGNGKGYGTWPTDSATGRRFPAKPQVTVELNSADTLDLQQLRGIGPGFARRIVQYREKLRGYYDKTQVLEVFGMDTARYGLIAGNLTTERDSIRPFDLNTVTIKELLRHPYFPFPVTKGIMVYRQKNKTFTSLDELRKVPGVTDSLFRRMVLYLRLGP